MVPDLREAGGVTFDAAMLVSNGSVKKPIAIYWDTASGKIGFSDAEESGATSRLITWLTTNEETMQTSNGWTTYHNAKIELLRPGAVIDPAQLQEATKGDFRDEGVEVSEADYCSAPTTRGGSSFAGPL